MANPQVEAGHTKIANELMEAMSRTNFSAYESRVLCCIFRKTYGWGKKQDRISYTQFEEATGLNRWHIARTIKLLLERGVIVCSGSGIMLEYGIQKDWEQWKDIHNNHQKSLPNGVTEDDKSSLPNGVTEDDKSSLPNGEKSLPNGEKSLPNGVTEIAPPSPHTPYPPRKAITKAYNKSSIAVLPFEKYKESLKINYPDIDVDREWEKCQIWWSEGKKKMRPKSALTNWIERVRRDKSQEGNYGRPGINRADSKAHVSRFGVTTTEELKRSVGRPIE